MVEQAEKESIASTWVNSRERVTIYPGNRVLGKGEGTEKKECTKVVK
jgi:hypothetical protein